MPLYVPDLELNVISVKYIIKKRCGIRCKGNYCYVTENGELLRNGEFELDYGRQNIKQVQEGIAIKHPATQCH